MIRTIHSLLSSIHHNPNEVLETTKMHQWCSSPMSAGCYGQRTNNHPTALFAETYYQPLIIATAWRYWANDPNITCNYYYICSLFSLFPEQPASQPKRPHRRLIIQQNQGWVTTWAFIFEQTNTNLQILSSLQLF